MRSPVRVPIEGEHLSSSFLAEGATAGAPQALIDANHPRSGYFRLGEFVDQVGSGPAREGETDRGQDRAEPLGPLAVPSGQAGYLLDERAASTSSVPAGEPVER
ncbi:hypothetical protein [Streptomyces sp. NPDC029004]|uniref:hypothetical protein n=1 Tax=Streptomyces sp. NPDC029004 TaxID=3154490 RepID=UPI0033DFA222